MKTLTYILILTLLISLFPYQTNADIPAIAINDARLDSDRNVNPDKWFWMGACIPGIGVYYANPLFIEIPLDRILGKPPEYVFFYMQEYNRNVQAIRLREMTKGTLTTFGVFTSLGCLISLRNSTR
ncbi:hypothetical protein C6497_12990 [Candidatus Poribacteria bacterium]|nr:MAG: hypothetical protein C6497_12990 [Candidatus Poribacteria bacterium]